MIYEVLSSSLNNEFLKKKIDFYVDRVKPNHLPGPNGRFEWFKLVQLQKNFSSKPKTVWLADDGSTNRSNPFLKPCNSLPSNYLK